MINRTPGARDSWFAGFLAQGSFGDRLTLGELFRRTLTAAAEPSAAKCKTGAIFEVAP